jgi:hypothetical protein
MIDKNKFGYDLGPAIFNELRKAGVYGEAAQTLIDKISGELWADFLDRVTETVQKDGWELRKGTDLHASTPPVSVDSDASPPAFPKPATPMQVQDFGHNGMSLRDYFAGQALTGLMASSATDDESFNGICDMAYSAADDMLARRGKG